MAIFVNGRCRLVKGSKGELVDILVGSEGVGMVVFIMEVFGVHGMAQPSEAWPCQVVQWGRLLLKRSEGTRCSSGWIKMAA